MVATFNGNRSTTIISCYALPMLMMKQTLIALYNKLSSLVRSTQKHNVLNIGGDMNA